jgi:hypothetical protein
MPVLTAVARILDNELTPKKAVMELMNLPQVNHLITFDSVLLNVVYSADSHQSPSVFQIAVQSCPNDLRIFELIHFK